MTVARLTRLPLLGLLAALVILPGCSSTKADYQSAELPDPLEGLNRAVYGFNTGLDYVVLGPASTLYREAVPTPFQDVIRNFFRNLEMPVIAINKLLQGNIDGFGTAVGRFFVNTIAGAGGIADIASYSGLKYEPTDFGVTLASWGADPAMYLVLPLVGSSSLRDGVGLGVDWLIDPVRIVADNNEINGQLMAVSALRILDTRAAYDAAISDTRRNSLDSYAAFRSLYAQHRAAEIKAQLGRGH